MKRSLWILFILAIIVRVSLFNFQSFHIDMSDWEAWSYRLVAYGPANFYSKEYFSDYFPGYLYFLWGIGYIYHLIFPKLSFATFQFEVFIKSITTLFDIGTSFLIFKIVQKLNAKMASLCSLFYFFNPAVVFNSSIWGQIDGIYTFFLVLSSYLLIEKLKPIKGAFFSSISFLIKPHSVILFPLLAINSLKAFRLKALIFPSSVFLLTLILLSVPFFKTNPIQGLYNLSQNSLNVYPYTSLFAFNFWSLLGWWKPDSQVFSVLTFKNWGILIYLSLLMIILIPLFSAKIKPKIFYLASVLLIMAPYLFLTRMHERYLFPALAFLAISVILGKRYIIFYFLISTFHLLNLWYVYYYYNFVYNNPRLTSNALYDFIDINHNSFSILLILIFFFVFFHYYGLSKKTN